MAKVGMKWSWHRYNQERAATGRQMAAIQGEKTQGDPRDTLVDAVANLLHWTAQTDRKLTENDLEDAVNTAFKHFVTEAGLSKKES